MIDTLRRHLPLATLDRIRDRIPVGGRPYAVLTLHRPSNVDDRETFRGILAGGAARSRAHAGGVSRCTRARATGCASSASTASWSGVILTEPLGYIDFLSLTSHARLILTDSGGLQEESTALGIPCLTLRENTERPITVTHGTNRVVGTRTADIVDGFEQAVGAATPARMPELWDGRAAERIAAVIGRFLFE